MDARYAFSRKASGKSGVGETAQSRGKGLAPHGMNLDIPDDELELLIKALDHYHAYTVARNAEDARYHALAERLKRKPSEWEPAAQPGKPAKRRA
jgi:hypothetical protein